MPGIKRVVGFFRCNAMALRMGYLPSKERLYLRHFCWVGGACSCAGAAQPLASDGNIGRFPLERLLKGQRQSDHGVWG